jgi:hypothetical protein
LKIGNKKKEGCYLFAAGGFEFSYEELSYFFSATLQYHFVVMQKPFSNIYNIKFNCNIPARQNFLSETFI